MNKLLCVATKKGLESLKAAVKINRNLIICTFKEIGMLESFHITIKDVAQEHGLPIITWKEFQSNPIQIIQQYEIQSILCIGWKYLIPDEVIRFLGVDNAVVAHDSLLPKLRGFAPLPTAIITNESETGVTFLLTGDGVDNGEILLQRSVVISPNDTIFSLIQKIIPIYEEGTVRFILNTWENRLMQNEYHATYSIWRDEEDYNLDWNQNAQIIHNTVRALGYPYLGAKSSLDDQIITIHETQVIEDIKFAIRQPGKILKLDDKGRPIVICGQGLLKILSMTNDNGSNLLPLNKLRMRFR